jgi:UDP-2,3-diacylglucosamine hydrolase
VPRTLFISDLHLDPSRPAVTGALADFLGRHTDCEALYILGDLFEAWIGDDDDAPLGLEVRDMLAQFRAAGSRLYLMHGNRDFLLGEDFCRAAGATLLPDPTVADLHGTPTLLMHGDTLCTRDRDYQAFRQQARAAAWQAQLLARPLKERRQLAAQLRQVSADATSNKAEDIMDVTPAEVTRTMAEHGVSRLIHGHTHRPAIHEEQTGQRLVLGDWGPQVWYAEVSRNNFKLLNYPI